MPRANTYRSQRASRSQPQQATQSRPSQTQRGGRSQHHDEEEEEEVEMDSAEDQDGEGEGSQANGAKSEVIRKANELVRLALFNEQKRLPLRREEIIKKVLGANSSRQFPTVFRQAQDILTNTFGMEMVELRSRAGLENAEAGDADELAAARNATGIKKRAVVAGSKSYILRSSLAPELQEVACVTDEKILQEETIHHAANVEDDDDEAPFGRRDYGSIISWSHGDQLAPTGILYVILSLILVNGRVMSDNGFRSSLKRLRLPANGTVYFNSQSTHRSLPIDTYLTQLMRQGYLDRQRTSDGKGAGAKRVRGAGLTQQNDDGVTYEWRWGTRAQSEVGEAGIARFIASFMMERSEEEDGDEDDEENERGRARDKNGKKRLERLMKGIEMAAGGNLSEIL